MDGNAGGIDKYLWNFLDTVSGEAVQIDFLTNEIDPALQKKLQMYHSRLFEIANLKHPVKQYMQIRRILQSEKYDAVYLNISTAIDCIAAIAAKHEKIPKRMIHSHSSGNDCENALKRVVFNSIHRVCKLFLWRNGTHFYGCSKKAGEWLFPKKIVESPKFEVIFNAVDRERFRFDGNVRREKRVELGLENCFVIGHAGNFCYQKNHKFLIEVFEEILKRNPKAVLLLVGKGIRFDDVKKQVKEAGIEQSVRFLGWRQDIDELFQAMDLFLLPSNFEGLPIAGIEAQSCGLPCIMSNTITREAKITRDCIFLPIGRTAKIWAEAATSHQWKRGSAQFLEMADCYDLKRQRKQLKNMI